MSDSGATKMNVKKGEGMKRDAKKLLGHSPSQLSMHKFVLVTYKPYHAFLCRLRYC